MANARATKLVNDIQRTALNLREIRKELYGIQQRYTAEGGQSFIHEHFLDANGVPRTDLDYTETQILDAIAALVSVIGELDTQKVPLIQVAA